MSGVRVEAGAGVGEIRVETSGDIRSVGAAAGVDSGVLANVRTGRLQAVVRKKISNNR